MFSTDGSVIFRLIRRQPYSEMKRSGIERNRAEHGGVEGRCEWKSKVNYLEKGKVDYFQKDIMLTFY